MNIITVFCGEYQSVGCVFNWFVFKFFGSVGIVYQRDIGVDVPCFVTPLSELFCQVFCHGIVVWSIRVCSDIPVGFTYGN